MVRNENLVDLLKFGGEQTIKRVVEADLTVLSLAALSHACRCLEESRDGTRNDLAKRQSALCRIAAQIAHDAAWYLQRDWNTGLCDGNRMTNRRRLFQVAVCLAARQTIFLRQGRRGVG